MGVLASALLCEGECTREPPPEAPETAATATEKGGREVVAGLLAEDTFLEWLPFSTSTELASSPAEADTELVGVGG